ncbi:MAG: aminoacyl-tRNA hydrolase, partial [Bacilli bacterium]|nr:aminoacyl-tRNA hydrolase [Bacilli bacterium]MDY0363768.1 aminoacyl-tRNA hydrolase [Bacilli bacterium]
MKLIVGLGNPGKEYSETRHNIGFLFVDEVVASFNQQFKLEKKIRSEIVRFKINEEEYVFLKPITFMNLSGEAVSL